MAAPTTWIAFLSWTIAHCCYSSAISDISISHVNILLPFNVADNAGVRLPVRFALSATGGCFKWFSSAPGIVSVVPGPERSGAECPTGTSRDVELIPAIMALEQRRSSVWVWAEHVGSQARVECEVFIDEINRLEFLTSTRVINVGDMELIELQAFDSHNNVFTSLKGLPFHWTNVNQIALQWLRFSEANIEVPKLSRLIEAAGGFSDKYPVKGVQTGVCQISARLTRHGYIDVAPATLTFSVVEPLYLSESFVALLPLTMVHLVLETRQRGAQLMHDRRVITMPSAQYKWASSDDTAACVDQSGNVIAKSVGRTLISVQDVNFNEHQKQVDVRVVHPQEISASVMSLLSPKTSDLPTAYETDIPSAFFDAESNSWQLIAGQPYRILFGLRGERGLKIHPSDLIKYDFRFDDDSELSIEIRDRSANSDWIDLRGILPCVKNVSVSLLPVRKGMALSYSPPSEIVASMALTVTLPVQLNSTHGRSLVVLPVPLGDGVSSFQVEATGGSGTFAFSVQNQTVATVDKQSGLIRCHSEGVSQLRIADWSNPLNFVVVPLHVVAQATFSILRPSVVEFPVDKILQIIVSVEDQAGRPFDDCCTFDFSMAIDVLSRNQVDVSTHSPHFSARHSSCYSVCPGYPGITCFVVSIAADSALFGQLVVEHRDQLTISAFDSVFVEQNSVLLAAGSSLSFTAVRGPLTWPGYPPPRVTFRAENPNMVRIQENSQREFQISCLETHSQNLVVNVTNYPTDLNPFPASSLSSMSVHCVPPLPNPVDGPLRLGIGIHHLIQISHPLAGEVVFYTDNPAVAVVSSSGEITGVGLGSCRIHYRIPHPSLNEVPAHEDGLHVVRDILVVFEGFAIIGLPPVLIVGTSYLCHIEGINGELPGDASFTDVSCNWTVDSDVVSITQLLHTSSMMERHVTGTSIRVHAHSSGEVKISARVNVDMFQADLVIPVIKKLSLTLDSVPAIILPIGSSWQIITSPESAVVSYDAIHIDDMPFPSGLHDEVQSSDNDRAGNQNTVVLADFKVDQFGSVNSGSEAAQFVVTVRDNRPIGPGQTSLLHFVVEPISEIFIEPDAVISSESLTGFFPGANITLSIFLRDRKQRFFQAVDSEIPFQAEPSNRDVTRVEFIPVELHSTNVAGTPQPIARIRVFALEPGTSTIVVSLPSFLERDQSIFCPIIVHAAESVTMRVSLPMAPAFFWTLAVLLRRPQQLEWERRLLGILYPADPNRLSIAAVDHCNGRVIFDIIYASNTSAQSIAEDIVHRFQNPQSPLRLFLNPSDWSLSSVTSYVGLPTPANSSTWTPILQCRIRAAPVSAMFINFASTLAQMAISILVGIAVMFGFQQWLKQRPPTKKSHTSYPVGPMIPAQAGPGVQSPYEVRARRYLREPSPAISSSYMSPSI